MVQVANAGTSPFPTCLEQETMMQAALCQKAPHCSKPLKSLQVQQWDAEMKLPCIDQYLASRKNRLARKERSVTRLCLARIR